MIGWLLQRKWDWLLLGMGGLLRFYSWRRVQFRLILSRTKFRRSLVISDGLIIGRWNEGCILSLLASVQGWANFVILAICISFRIANIFVLRIINSRHCLIILATDNVPLYCFFPSIFFILLTIIDLSLLFSLLLILQLLALFL